MTVDTEYAARVEILAGRVEMLFVFAASLLPDRDILRDAADDCSQRADFAISAAPLLGAVGLDFDRASMQHTLYAKRAKALLELLNVLVETEAERERYNTLAGRRADVRAQLAERLGL